MAKRWPVAFGALLLVSGCSALANPTRDAISIEAVPLQYSNPRQIQATPAPVTVTFARAGDSLIVHFRVTAATIAAKPHLARNQYPYEYDVVELFVRNASSGTPGYYEFEVSPYNQSLQVNVVEPRQEYYFGVRNGFTHTATIAPGGWEAEMKIPLASIGWDGGEPVQLVGNAYAALGVDEQRVYWSLFELPPGKPDFHVPSAFRPLLGAN